jgi:hypothetical protein
MAEDESKRAEKQGNTNPEVPPAARGIAQEFDFLSQFADSGPSRTVIPAHCGQRSGDCGQFLMSV